jgi:hypothetical protein
MASSYSRFVLHAVKAKELNLKTHEIHEKKTNSKTGNGFSNCGRVQPRPRGSPTRKRGRNKGVA